MAAQAPAAVGAAGPKVIEGPGRYAVYEAPDGGWIVARAVGLCESCQGCGCGDQAERIDIPAMVIALAKRNSRGKLLGLLKGGGTHV